MSILLDGLQLDLNNSYHDQNYNSSENNFSDEKKTIDFEKQKNKKEVDYTDPDYNVFKDKNDKKREEKEKKSKENFNYTLKFDSDFNFKTDEWDTEKSEFDPNDIPVGNSQTVREKKINSTSISEKSESDGDEFGKTATDFLKVNFLKEFNF